MSDVTLALSSRAIEATAKTILEHFSLDLHRHPPHPLHHPFDFEYDLVAVVTHGSLVMSDVHNGEFTLRQIGLHFDEMRGRVLVSIPQQNIGGFCIISVFGHCILRFPGFSIFGGDPDFSFGLDLSGLLTVRADIGGHVRADLVRPSTNPNETYLDKEDHTDFDRWQIFFDPDINTFDLFIDPLLSLDDWLHRVVEGTVRSFLSSFLPGFVVDIIMGIFHFILDIISAILSGLSDVLAWLVRLVESTIIDLFFKEQFLAFIKKNTLFEIETPYKVLDGGALIPLKMPIANLALVTSAAELLVTADVGDL
jgi:hypothetical protein